MGGGNSRFLSATTDLAGLSPRGRGKPAGSVARRYLRRSIPAWAGETSTLDHCRAEVQVYPRVGGGNTPKRSGGGSAKGLSPRGRGKPSLHSQDAKGAGSIPAWAGETPAHPATAPSPPVYPRVGGGNQNGQSAYPVDWGLSPRGRGKLLSVYS